MRQTKFEFAKGKERLIHGCNTREGKRKEARPICTKRPFHLILKCRRKIFEDRHVIINLLIPTAHKFKIPIFSFAIAHDHVHFLTKLPSRAAYVQFIRALTGMLAKKLGKNFISSATGMKPWAGSSTNREAGKGAHQTRNRPTGFPTLRSRVTYRPQPFRSGAPKPAFPRADQLSRSTRVSNGQYLAAAPS